MTQSAEFDAFSCLVATVIAVPKEELLRLEAEYKQQAARNPKRRGPKKVGDQQFTSSASPAPDAS